MITRFQSCVLLKLCRVFGTARTEQRGRKAQKEKGKNVFAVHSRAFGSKWFSRLQDGFSQEIQAQQSEFSSLHHAYGLPWFCKIVHFKQCETKWRRPTSMTLWKTWIFSFFSVSLLYFSHVVPYFTLFWQKSQHFLINVNNSIPVLIINANNTNINFTQIQDKKKQ